MGELKCRVPGKPELLDLPSGTEVIDLDGQVWKTGGRDGSCVKLIGPHWYVLRFYTPIHQVDDIWYISE